MKKFFIGQEVRLIPETRKDFINLHRMNSSVANLPKMVIDRLHPDGAIKSFLSSGVYIRPEENQYFEAIESSTEVNVLFTEKKIKEDGHLDGIHTLALVDPRNLHKEFKGSSFYSTEPLDVLCKSLESMHTRNFNLSQFNHAYMLVDGLLVEIVNFKQNVAKPEYLSVGTIARFVEDFHWQLPKGAVVEILEVDESDSDLPYKLKIVNTSYTEWVSGDCKLEVL